MTWQHIFAGLLVLVAIAIIIFRARSIASGQGGCGCCGMRNECESKTAEPGTGNKSTTKPCE